MSTHHSLLLIVRFISDTTVDRLGNTWSVRFSYGWSFVLFGTTATFLRFVSLFIADIAIFFEALIFVFLGLAFVPWDNLLSLQAFESRHFSF